MKQYFLMLPLAVFPACLFQPQVGPNPIVANFDEGVIIMEDVGGAVKAADIKAMFVDRSDRAFMRVADELAAPECDDIVKEIKTVESKKTALMSGRLAVGSTTRDAALLNIGDLRFRLKPQDSSQFISLGYSGGIYYLPLSAGIASGEYVFRASQMGGNLVFDETLSMPESIAALTGNGLAFDAGVYAKKDQDLELSWDTPTVAAELNSLKLLYQTQVQISDTKVELQTLACRVREAYFLETEEGAAVPARITWKIPADIMNQLPETKTAAVQLTRARGVPGAQGKLELWGVRSMIAASRLDAALPE